MLDKEATGYGFKRLLNELRLYIKVDSYTHATPIVRTVLCNYKKKNIKKLVLPMELYERTADRRLPKFIKLYFL